jgi:AcrR family transcriptional regulator
MIHEFHKPASADGYHHGDLRRALIDSALAIVAKEQHWAFSLREVARHAGVSHNAPYNHFADKRELLAAVAAAGYEALLVKMLNSLSDRDGADKALVKIGVVYVKFGLENPAHFRLMFSSELNAATGERPAVVVDAGVKTKELLESIIRRGVRTGVFSNAFNRNEDLQAAVLTAWSAVHGLTMLAIDGLPAIPRKLIDQIADKLTKIVCQGLMHH